MASQYDAHLAGEALRSSQEHLSDLSFNMEDGENRLAELQAQFAHMEDQVGAADALRAEAEGRRADLEEQVRAGAVMCIACAMRYTRLAPAPRMPTPLHGSLMRASDGTLAHAPLFTGKPAPQSGWQASPPDTCCSNTVSAPTDDVQVAEERARSKKLAEKLAAVRQASSSTPVHAQLACAEEAKRRAEQHAETLRQVWCFP